MTITDSSIYLREVRFHAFHGVMPQEQKVGADFTVSVRVWLNLQSPIKHDSVETTLNYADLYKVVKREMMIPSQLLEHVAGRIGRAVLEAFPQVSELELSVTKLNPPMGADCAGAGVTLHLINDKTQP